MLTKLDFNIFIEIINNYLFFDLLKFSKWTMIKYLSQCNKKFNFLYGGIISIATYNDYIHNIDIPNRCCICGELIPIYRHDDELCIICEDIEKCINCTFILSKPLTNKQKENKEYYKYENGRWPEYKKILISENDRICVGCCDDIDIIYTTNLNETIKLKKKYYNYKLGSELIDATLGFGEYLKINNLNILKKYLLAWKFIKINKT